MQITRKRLYAFAALIALLCIFLVFMCLSMTPARPLRQGLVGPANKAVEMLFRGSPMDQIEAAARAEGNDMDALPHMGGSLIYWAADCGRNDVLRWALQKGANPNGVHPAMVPLERAVHRRDLAAIRLLVKAGADPNRDSGSLLSR